MWGGLLGGLLGGLGGKAPKVKGGGLLGFAASGMGIAAGGRGRRRRRRARLSQGELAELNQIKAILGKTAAANALPFYMGRGR